MLPFGSFWVDSIFSLGGFVDLIQDGWRVWVFVGSKLFIGLFDGLGVKEFESDEMGGSGDESEKESLVGGFFEDDLVVFA